MSQRCKRSGTAQLDERAPLQCHHERMRTVQAAERGAPIGVQTAPEAETVV